MIRVYGSNFWGLGINLRGYYNQETSAGKLWKVEEQWWSVYPRVFTTNNAWTRGSKRRGGFGTSSSSLFVCASGESHHYLQK